MTTILKGDELNKRIARILSGRIATLPALPKMVIVQVGDNDESNIYIRRKKLFGENIGALVHQRKYDGSISEDAVIADIKADNTDVSVTGIVIQLPLPAGLDKNRILEAIDPRKDIDGLTAANIKRLFDGEPGFVPGVVKGVLILLDHFGITSDGKQVVIVGDSSLVGRPLALAFLNNGATVTICNKRTTMLAEKTKKANILVSAVGQPGLITSAHVAAGQVIVDVGLTTVHDLSTLLAKRRIIGDVDYQEVKDLVKAITPVPGGVGPLTVAALFENLVEAAEGQRVITGSIDIEAMR